MKIILLFAWIMTALPAGAQADTILLLQNWKFSKAGSAEWYDAEVPGTVHTDLFQNKLIPDPFYRAHEEDVSWIEKTAFHYKLIFHLPEEFLQHKQPELQFDGLDTYAHVILNDSLVLVADNMFRQWSAAVTNLLKSGSNTLEVKFFPAAMQAKLLKEKSLLPYPDNERVFVRKAQYHFGWDWGPRLVTCGIWKDVRLVGKNQHAKPVQHSRHWDVQLVREKDSIGESFYFKKEGKAIFIKGANWIPADNFLPRAKKLQLYEKRIRDASLANINMLRVWGGGIYEDDAFYELCDKYGIMVWQDFMFAGALYPADDIFLKNIEAEVRYQVNRLKKFSCIVLWCGNNEIEEAWFNWGWQKQMGYSREDSLKLWLQYQAVFHELIPRIVKELDPERPYWPSSPSLGWGRDSAYKQGDVHYWGVWWGKEPVEKYRDKVGRFNSEFGMQAMPDMKSIRQFSIQQDWDTSSKVMKVHQKHPFGWENIKLYIDRKFKAPENFEDLVYVSQLMQANAIQTALEAHRLSQPKSMGSLFWQWNDCWPVTSWSAVDYYGRKKAMYYQVKRSFSNLLILPYLESDQYGIRIISDLDSNLVAKVETDFIAFHSSEKNTLKTRDSFLLKSGSVLNLRSHRDSWKEHPQNGCMRFRLVSNGKTLAENILFLDDPKNLQLEKPTITWKWIDNILELTTDKFAYGVYLDIPDDLEVEDNYFHLLPGEKKLVRFSSPVNHEKLKKVIQIKSLFDTY